MEGNSHAAESELELERAAMMMLALDAALTEITTSLAKRQIQPLLLKGAGTARLLYDRPHERAYSDIDLLVDPARFGETLTALRELGFDQSPTMTDPGVSTHHEVLLRPGPPPAFLELHHTIYFVTAPGDVVWRALTREADAIEIAGVPVRVPSPAAAALILTLHAVHHGTETGKPMRDLALAVERLDLETWRSATAIADELGVRAVFAFGLRLIPQGAELADRLMLPVEAVSRLVRLHAMTAPRTSAGVERVITAQGPMARLRVLGRELFPTAEFMRQVEPVATRGHLGLGLAYLMRPFRLIATLPAGMRAWRQVARAARRSD